MEYEIDDQPQGGKGASKDDKDDSRVVKDHKALRNQSSVDPEEYPNARDRALHIPEQDDG